MLKISLKISLVLVLALLFSTCKKYPDGPKIALHTVKNRITGIFKLDKFIIDGIDSVNYLPPCQQINDIGLADKEAYYFKFEGGDIKGLDGFGSYTLSGDQSSIYLSYSHYSAHNYPTNYRNIIEPYANNTDDGKWEIRKLTNKEFWIRNSANNVLYEIHLKKL